MFFSISLDIDLAFYLNFVIRLWFFEAVGYEVGSAQKINFFRFPIWFNQNDREASEIIMAQRRSLRDLGAKHSLKIFALRRPPVEK